MDALSFIVSLSPQTQTLFTDIISFDLSIHIHSEPPGGKKSSEHVYEVEYAGAALSVRSKSFPNAFSVKLLQYRNVMRKIGSTIKLAQ